MSVKRRDIRESAFLLLFEKMFRPDDSFEDIYETADNAEGILLNDSVKKLVENVYNNSEKLDEIISGYSDKRTVARIPKINLCILRVAIYEALNDKTVPVNVAISEAVALTGKYALEADISFVNGVLGAFAKDTEANK